MASYEGIVTDGTDESDDDSLADKWVPVSDLLNEFSDDIGNDKWIPSNPKGTPEQVEDQKDKKLTETVYNYFLRKVKTLDQKEMQEYLDRIFSKLKIGFKIGIIGRSATGKSTFINTIRGVEQGDKYYAETGFGDQTLEVQQYKNPFNKNVIYYDCPGLSLATPKSEFMEMVDLTMFDYVVVFFESALCTEEASLVEMLSDRSIPFCLVRNKVDNDIENGRKRNMDENDVLYKLRKHIKKSVATSKALADAGVFFISAQQPEIGEFAKLRFHMEKSLPAIKSHLFIMCNPTLYDVSVKNEVKGMTNEKRERTLFSRILEYSFTQMCSDIKQKIKRIFGLS